MESELNRIADIKELRYKYGEICNEINKFKRFLEKKNIPHSPHLPWVRKWEYSKAIAETRVSKGDIILDAGGAYTVFSYYLGKIGTICHSLDINKKIVKLSNKASKKLRLNLFHSVQSITNLAYKDELFDYIFCICVLEHIHYSQQERAIKELARVLKKGGILVITVDFGWKCTDYPFFSFQDILKRLVLPSNLELVGNKKFILQPRDLSSRPIYSKLSYAVASIFLRKREENEKTDSPKMLMKLNSISLREYTPSLFLNALLIWLPPFLKFKIRNILIKFLLPLKKLFSAKFKLKKRKVKLK